MPSLLVKLELKIFFSGELRNFFKLIMIILYVLCFETF